MDDPTATVQQLSTLPTFPPPEDAAHAQSGDYVFKYDHEHSVTSFNDVMQAQVWFRLPHLDADMMKRMIGIQLFVESHDQGYVDVSAAGNWTWFEFAVLDNSTSEAPRTRDGVEMTWRSHYNRLGSEDFGWSEGPLFEKSHQLFSQLDDDDVIGVRLCSRFAGWSIDARSALVLVKLGEETPPLPRFDYKTLLDGVHAAQDIFAEVNAQTKVAFVPNAPKSLLSAGAIGTGEERPLRVLALDGGGVRGMSSLYILRALLRKLYPDKKDEDIKPCEIFDMIAGTSTGGLIAIMLGRLKMSVQECIDEYESLSKKIFSAFWKTGSFVVDGSYYDAAPLENGIKACIAKKLGDENAPLLDESSNCKVFVLAVRADAINNRGPVLLRSYTNPHDASLIPECLIWQAGRATSAAPVYFKSITVGKYELLDGGLGANNPLGWLWNEVLDVYGAARPTDCFLSIGTGIPENTPLGTPGVLSQATFAANLSSAATNSQLTNLLFKALLNAYAPTPMLKKYWRLNIGEGIPEHDETIKVGVWPFQKEETVHKLDNFKDVGDMDDVSKMDFLKSMTDAYITAQDWLLSDCVNALRDRI